MFLRLPLLLEWQARATSLQRRGPATFHLFQTISQPTRAAFTRKIAGKTLQPLTWFLIVYRKFVCFSFLTFANSISSPSGSTPLIWSVRRGHLEICRLLISSKSDVNASTQGYATHTPLTFFEIVYLKFVCFSFLTFANSISSPSGATPLIRSAYYGHLEICRLLISSKADLAARDRCGRCQRCSRFSLNQSHPLACSRGNTALKCAMNENKSDVVAFLRGIGAPE